jgi:hypothetical protein
VADIRSIVFESVRLATLSDATNDPAGPFAGFYCNTAGNIYYQTIQNDTAWVNALAGVIYPIAVLRVRNTSTTASTIYGVLAQPYRTRPST